MALKRNITPCQDLGGRAPFLVESNSIDNVHFLDCTTTRISPDPTAPESPAPSLYYPLIPIGEVGKDRSYQDRHGLVRDLSEGT